MYVVDAPAILSVSLGASDANEVFLGMNALVNGGDLCFCNEVIDELGRTAKNEPALVWASSVSASRAHKGAAYSYVEWVGHDFPQIVDTTARDTQESAAPYVVAQALELRDGGQQVTVVSQDLLPKPTRASLREACDHFGLRCISLAEFLDEAELLSDDDEDELDYEEEEEEEES